MRLGNLKINSKVITFGIGLGIGICLNLGVKADAKILSSIVSYDNTNTNLTAINVQDALDETYSKIINIKNDIKTELIDDVYPVGSIYISTVDDTVTKVQERFGGTWVKYSEGTTLIGANDTYQANTSGGSSTVKLSTSNLPSHNHPIPQLSVSSWSGSHNHIENANLWSNASPSSSGNHYIIRGSAGNYMTTNGDSSTGKRGNLYTNSTSITVSGQKTTASNTNGCTNCSGTSFSVQNPYTAVYMYKRVS